MMKSKWRMAFLGVAVALGGTLWLSKARLQRRALEWIVLHEDTPGEFAMREVVDTSPDRAQALEKLWMTGRIAPREFVAGYLRDQSIFTMFSTIWPHMKPVAMDALSYGDMDTQQAALAVLEATHDADAVPVALAMLDDVDPTIRYQALLLLQRTRDNRYLPVYMRMLDDRDRSVCTCAAGGLSTLTDQDFGIRFDIDAKKHEEAVKAWKAWWAGQKDKYPDAALPAPAKWSTTPMGAAPDFSLPDVDGKTVRLSDLKGKPVLLVFFTTWYASCVRQVPALAEFHRRRGNDVVILGVTVDDLKDLETGKAHFGLEGTVNERVKKFIEAHQVPYRIVLDNEGRALGPYGGGDLPVAVWIDRNGIMRRRFMGPRSADVLVEMLDSLDAPANKPS